MKCHSQFCDLHSLPGVLPPAAESLRPCFPNPALSQHTLVICNNANLLARLHPPSLWDVANLLTQLPRVSQAHRSFAFSIHKCERILWTSLSAQAHVGRRTHVSTAPACKWDSPSLDCRIKMNTSHPIYLLLYFLHQLKARRLDSF